jgi:rSAM/selenodomain-associated transferase 1
VLHPQAAILIFAKAPVAGRVKTRLIPVLGEEGALLLYRGLLRHQLERLSNAGLASLQLWCSPDTTHPEFQALSENLGISLHTQQGEDLGERMALAATDALHSHRSVLLLGIDSPGLALTGIAQALDWLAGGVNAVLGPAEDGGYVLLGLKQTADCLFRDIPWGGDRVASMTRQCLEGLGWRWRELPASWDLDLPQDLARLQTLEWGRRWLADQALPNELAVWFERASPDGP